MLASELRCGRLCLRLSFSHLELLLRECLSLLLCHGLLLFHLLLVRPCNGILCGSNGVQLQLGWLLGVRLLLQLLMLLLELLLLEVLLNLLLGDCHGLS